MNLKLPWYWLPCTRWPWHGIFKVKFSNGCISGTGCPIGKKRKWYELKQCLSHNLTLTFDLPMTIFQLLNLRKGLSVWHEMKGIWIDMMLDPQYDLDLWSHPWLWPWIFRSNLEIAVSQEWMGPALFEHLHRCIRKCIKAVNGNMEKNKSMGVGIPDYCVVSLI